MSYIVSTMKKISFAPASVAEEVVQNVRCIIATHVGTVPLYRDFGISWEGIDRPIPVAQALIRAEVIDAVQKYEPRAVVDSVTWEENTGDAMEGLLHPVVTISLAEGVEDASTEGATSAIATLYQQASRAVALATDLVALEQNIAARFVEMEITDYVRIFDLGAASRTESSTQSSSVSGSVTTSESLIGTAVMMIDTANSVAAQIAVDTKYYTKVLHEFERIAYAEIYEAGSVTHESFDPSPDDPEEITSAAGVTDVSELTALANAAYASIISARTQLLSLERGLGEIERADLTSIYDTEEQN